MASQWLNAELKARISTATELCVSVVTALIIGSITAHIMRGVNPHHGGFLGENFIPTINRSVCY